MKSLPHEFLDSKRLRFLWLGVTVTWALGAIAFALSFWFRLMVAGLGDRLYMSAEGGRASLAISIRALYLFSSEQRYDYTIKLVGTSWAYAWSDRLGASSLSLTISPVLYGVALVIICFFISRHWVKQERYRSSPLKCCEICGYDVRATPNVCPECGSNLQAG